MDTWQLMEFTGCKTPTLGLELNAWRLASTKDGSTVYIWYVVTRHHDPYRFRIRVINRLPSALLTQHPLLPPHLSNGKPSVSAQGYCANGQSCSRDTLQDEAHSRGCGDQRLVHRLCCSVSSYTPPISGLIFIYYYYMLYIIYYILYIIYYILYIIYYILYIIYYILYIIYYIFFIIFFIIYLYIYLYCLNPWQIC